MNALISVIKRALGVLVALLVLFEEWGWEPLQRLMAWIARLPGLRHLEALIARAPPLAALFVLVVPGLLLVPAKLMGLWLFAQGQPVLGVAVFALAKVVGTALVARLFALTRPALLRLHWFAAIYLRWVAWKTVVLARVRESWAWRTGRAVKREALRQWERWRAAHSP